MNDILTGEKINVYHTDELRSYAFHFHNGYEMIYVAEGSAQFNINGVQHHCREGQVIFLNQMERHGMRPVGSRYVRYVAIFDPDFFDRCIPDPVLCSIFKHRPENFRNVVGLDGEAAAHLRRQFEESIAELQGKQPHYELGVMGRMLQALIHIYRGNPGSFPSPSTGYSAELGSRAQSYLDAHYLEDLTLEGVAMALHINKFHLAHLFREVTGYTVKQYILLKRLAHAKNLLYYSQRSIELIAADCGFHSASNFIRAFKKYEEMTPLRYRKLVRSQP